MAGAGYKLFNTGDVLTAAQVNTYLMQQTVMVFASSAARTSALSGVLAEGMVSYLQDSNTLEVYDGSAWVGATGDITGLTAGTGITITNATGPVPTVTNDVVTTIDAKGDLIVGTGDNTYVRQAVGSNNQVLMADSVQADGVKWANEATATLTAKGDILTATAANTLARLAVGNSGETIVADSSATTGLRWQGNFAAGKNAIINGDFRINQRSFSSTTTDGTFGFDRWFLNLTAGGGTVTYSAQTFTAGTAPVSGYEGTNFARIVTASQSTSASLATIRQKIEDVRTFAGQTVTVSFWAKAASGTPSILASFIQNFGSGGSPSSQVFATTTSQTISTSWARYSFTFNIPSISGKTLGTNGNSYLMLSIVVSSGSDYNSVLGTLGVQNGTFDIWGVQVEAGNVATAFQTATGTLAGELAACQRYYFRNSANATDTYAYFGQGFTNTTTNARMLINLPVTMRVKPTSVDFASLGIQEQFAGNIFAVSAISIGGDGGGPNPVFINATCATATGTKYSVILSNGSSTGYLGFSAEL